MIQCDYNNLKYFQTHKVLSWRHPRWAEIVSSHCFVIEHLDGKITPADWLSRRYDYEIGYQRQAIQLHSNMATSMVGPYNDQLRETNTAQATNVLATDVKCRIIGTPIIDDS